MILPCSQLEGQSYFKDPCGVCTCSSSWLPWQALTRILGYVTAISSEKKSYFLKLSHLLPENWWNSPCNRKRLLWSRTCPAKTLPSSITWSKCHKPAECSRVVTLHKLNTWYKLSLAGTTVSLAGQILNTEELFPAKQSTFYYIKENQHSVFQPVDLNIKFRWIITYNYAIYVSERKKILQALTCSDWQWEGGGAALDLLCHHYSCVTMNGAQSSKRHPCSRACSPSTAPWCSVPSPGMDCHSTARCTERYNYPCLWKLPTFSIRGEKKHGGIEPIVTVLSPIFLFYIPSDATSLATSGSWIYCCFIPCQVVQFQHSFLIYL